MTLIQFRSLMFHLRALDAQFMQGSGVQLHNLCEKESQTNTVSVGQKRTWTEMDDSNVSIDKKVRHEQTDTIAWEELDNILATISPADDVKLESNSIHAQGSVTYIPTPILSQKAVRNELAISYAEEIAILLPSLVQDACKGCKSKVDQNTNEQQHDVCKLPRRKRIELFTEMALLLIDVNSVNTKVITRLKNRHATFNEK